MPISHIQQQYYMEKLAGRLSCIFANGLILAMQAAGTTNCDIEDLSEGIDQAISRVEELVIEIAKQAKQTKDESK